MEPETDGLGLGKGGTTADAADGRGWSGDMKPSTWGSGPGRGCLTWLAGCSHFVET